MSGLLLMTPKDDFYLHSPYTWTNERYPAYNLHQRSYRLSTRLDSILPSLHALASRNRTGNTAYRRHQRVARPCALAKAAYSPKDAATSLQCWWAHSLPPGAMEKRNPGPEHTQRDPTCRRIRGSRCHYPCAGCRPHRTIWPMRVRKLAWDPRRWAGHRGDAARIAASLPAEGRPRDELWWFGMLRGSHCWIASTCRRGFAWCRATW